MKNGKRAYTIGWLASHPEPFFARTDRPSIVPPGESGDIHMGKSTDNASLKGGLAWRIQPRATN
jgi:hypothetical protein